VRTKREKTNENKHLQEMGFIKGSPKPLPPEIRAVVLGVFFAPKYSRKIGGELTMKKRNLIIILCLLFLLHFGIHAASEESENIIVTAVGEAAGTGMAAKEKSRENALRNAVEKGFGVYIDSATLTENAALIHDEVIAETRGYVRSYQTLEQTQQDGIFTTKIRAEVSMDKIWESQSLNLLLKRMGAPRFVIIAAENHEGHPAQESYALQKVTEILVEKGFHLINAAKTGNLSTWKIKNALANERLAAEIGKKADAEIIVLVNSSGAFAREAEAYGNRFKIFKGHCEVRVVQVDTRRIVATAIKTRQSGTLKQAIMAAANDNAGAFIKQLLSAWSTYLNMGRAIELVITNISVSQLMRIVEQVQSLEGVSSVEQRTFSGGRAQLEIKSKHKAMYLAESIENLPGIKLEISSFSADKIVVKKK
jgi:hypothetical protein